MREKIDVLTEFNEKTNKFAESFILIPEQLEFHKLSIILRCRYTTSITLNMEKYEFLRMHIDHSTIFEIETAHESRNRICIYIGTETRYLYIINLTLLQIKEMLSTVMNPENINVENISDHFFKHFPAYPVLNFKQSPYEYYIAPTDNLIYDGSTYLSNYLDLIITFLGNFI